MADRTTETQINTNWTEITGPLALEDGALYTVDVMQPSEPGPRP